MNKKDTKAFRDFEEKHSRAQTYMDEFFEEFNDYEDLYWSFIDESKHPYQAKVFDPMVFEKVERVTAHLAASMPRGSVMPADVMDALDNFGAVALDELFKYQWRNPKLKHQTKLVKLIKTFALFGTAFATLHWKYTRRKNSDGTYTIMCDQPNLEPLNIYDCFPDPSADSLETMKYFIHYDYTTIKALEAENRKVKGVSRYKNLDELKDRVKKDGTPSVDAYRGRTGPYREQEKDMTGTIKIGRMYTRNKWVSVAVDYNIVIENRDNPYIHGEMPILKVDDHEYPHQVMGIGEVQPIKALQKAINAIVNQRLDNVEFMMKPIFKVKDKSYRNSWKVKPGAFWNVRDMNDVEPFIFPDATANMFVQTTQYLKGSAEQALGTYDVLNKGVDNRTATEVKAVVGEQNARMRLKEFNVDQFISHMGTMWAQLNQQFITSERFIRIVGDEALQMLRNMEEVKPFTEVQGMDGVEYIENTENYIDGKPRFIDKEKYGFLGFTPEDIRGQYDFVVESGSTTVNDRVGERDDILNAISLLQNNFDMLQMQGININIRPLLEKLLKQLGINNIDDVFEKQEPMPQEGMMPPEAMPQEESLPLIV
jgi:hypothetical protein